MSFLDKITGVFAHPYTNGPRDPMVALSTQRGDHVDVLSVADARAKASEMRRLADELDAAADRCDALLAQQAQSKIERDHAMLVRQVNDPAARA